MLKPAGLIQLPEHLKPGGFDHGAVHSTLQRLYVAHTVNDALDVIDIEAKRYSHSINELTGVAGALVSEERNLIFTSNRGENTVSIFAAEDETRLATVPVGIKPNGLAYSHTLDLLLVAHVGDPALPGSCTVALINVREGKVAASIPMPGRTRWTVYDSQREVFFVNVADPPKIYSVNARQPGKVDGVYDIPASGPHGLDLDLSGRRLFCACDGKRLLSLDADSGQVLASAELSGSPDVIFFNAALNHVYVAVGDPGVVEVFDTTPLQREETITTEKGAHTLAFDAARNRIYGFLPQTHCAAIYEDNSI